MAWNGVTGVHYKTCEGCAVIAGREGEGMSRKYIIVIPDDEIVKYSGASHLFVPYEIAGAHGYIDTGLSMTSYEEPDLEAIRQEAYDKGKMDACVEDSKNITELKKEAEEAYQKGSVDAWECAKKNAGEAYQKGLNDAWEAARKIVLSTEDGGLFDYEARKAVFGCGNYMALKKYTVSEVIEKIRQYEQEQEEQIRVWDEVINGRNFKGTVTYTENNGMLTIFCQDGTWITSHSRYWKKTGRRFDEIAEVLKKMQE